MFRSHLKNAMRSLIRRKSHTAINVAGLAVGIAVCLIIFMVIRFELSFDTHHQNKDRIYRVLTEIHHSDAPDLFYSKGVAFALPEVLKSEIPQLEAISPVYGPGGAQILVLDENGSALKKFKEDDGVFFTEPSLFNMIDVNWLAGGQNALAEPNKVVLDKETAIKYFGSWESAFGNNIKWDDREILEVAGIIDKVPDASDLQLKVVISFSTPPTAQLARSDDWDSVNGNYGCFVMLHPNASATSVTSQLRELAKERKSEGNDDSLVLQPLSDIHFDTETGNYSGKSISDGAIGVLWLVAGFILLIACVNFINLATAQTLIRNKEIGVRKVLGSNSSQLKLQFFTEAFFIVAFAVLVSIPITLASLTYLGTLLDLPLHPEMLLQSEVAFFLAGLLIAVTFLAGAYPAVILSRFKPADAFRNQLAKLGSGGISLRRGLVVFQFVVAQVLIFSTLIVVFQMDYFMNRPLGFEKEALLNIPVPRDSISLSKTGSLRNDLELVNGVTEVSFSSASPTEDGNNWTTFLFDKAPDETDFYAIQKGVDQNFLPVYEIELLAGRNFRPFSENQEFLVNETLVKALGFTKPEDVLNKEINLWEGEVVGPVVGIVKDFHERSFKDGIAPLLMTNEPSFYGLAGIKFIPGQAAQVLENIEGIWDQTFPNQVFEYQFLDDKIANYYDQELRMSQMYRLAAAIAIFLSCLGLYGLASFMITQRIREVGIRKVLGASVRQIMYLFSKEFIQLICIAFGIAAPIAWYFMNHWLQGYEYHLEIGTPVFLIGGLTALLIALATISYLTIRAAVSNPVDSLRTE